MKTKQFEHKGQTYFAVPSSPSNRKRIGKLGRLTKPGNCPFIDIYPEGFEVLEGRTFVERAKGEKPALIITDKDLEAINKAREYLIEGYKRDATKPRPYFGPNGPTGHGDICHSDATPGL